MDTATKSTSHSHGPTPAPRPLKSSRQPKAKVGAIVGGGLGIVVVIFAFFFWRYRILRAAKRKRLASSARRDVADLSRDIENRAPPELLHPRDKTAELAPAPAVLLRAVTQSKAQLRQEYLANELRAVQKQHEALRRIQEKQRAGHAEPAQSVDPAPVVGVGATNPTDPSVEIVTTPADLESAQRQNEMLRRRIRELEQQQQSDWARGLSDQPPPGYSE
ncbi:hypothetical protein DFH09DRAFT_1164562 [Mycena vulgaris]|nr:hypothetical protein DFH09DRAFT_1164562 [Mycena vulgaris]